MIVVDTSVAVKWVVPEDGSGVEASTAAALDLLPHMLVAPDCLLGEFANAMFKKARRREIGREQALESLAVLPTIVNMLPLASFAEAALNLALDIDHPFHDCAFLAAAMQLEADLVTADLKFIDSCRATGRQFPIRQLGAGASA